MKTAISTDTNSGITAEEGKKAGIFVLPMPVIIDGNSYLEEVDITHGQLYEAMHKDKDISSSQPSPGAVTDLWDEIFQKGYDEIVHIPMSSELSGSCHNAMQLAQEYDSRVRVVDNHRISVTLMASVMEGKAMARQGYTALEIKEVLEHNAYEASIYLTVNSLKYLKKSGRITPSAAAIANVLNIKPVLTIQGGKLDAFAKVRGIKQCQRKMIEAIQEDIAHRFSQVPSHMLTIATAGTLEQEEEARQWTALVQSAFPETSIHYYPLSCSIACHLGIGALGIGVFKTPK